MARVTLYVPENLKARMDNVSEPVNWSAVAQEAFKEAVAVNLIQREPTNMEQVIERLRASKARADRTALQSGREHGKLWACETAEYDELKRIADWTRMEGVVIPFNISALKEVIDPSRRKDKYAWHEFWQKHSDGDVNDAFAEGFIKSAAKIFQEIECHL